MLLDCRIRDGVKGIHFTLNKMGRPTGIAFIEMEDEVDVNKALEKHRQYLGPRYVEGWSSPTAVLSCYSRRICVNICVLQCMKWRRVMLKPSWRKPQAVKLMMGWCGSEVSPSAPPRLTSLSFFQVIDIIFSLASDTESFSVLICRNKGSITWLLFKTLQSTARDFYPWALWFLLLHSFSLIYSFKHTQVFLESV